MFGWLRRLLGLTHPALNLGEMGERLAVRHLRRQGLRILVRNYRCEMGEIDIVASDGDTLVFVEVKTRRREEPAPELQVDRAKQRQLARVARRYLSLYGTRQPPARFDVVAVVWPEDGSPAIRHIRDAFEAAW